MRGRESVDNLYEPTLADLDERPAGSDPPWRLDSQGYVAFFGGPLAAAVVGVLNGRRLGLDRDRLLAIGAIGVVGLAVAIAAYALIGFEGRTPRLLLAVAGILTYLGTRKLQQPADRLFQMHPDTDEDSYDSLWGTGFLIVVVCGLGSVALVGAIG